MAGHELDRFGSAIALSGDALIVGADGFDNFFDRAIVEDAAFIFDYGARNETAVTHAVGSVSTPNHTLLPVLGLLMLVTTLAFGRGALQRPLLRRDDL